MFKIFNKKTPADLAEIRKVNTTNINSSKDLMSGITKTYLQMHDPNIANKILKEGLETFKNRHYKAK